MFEDEPSSTLIDLSDFEFERRKIDLAAPISDEQEISGKPIVWLLVVTSALLVATSALLVGTRSY